MDLRSVGFRKTRDKMMAASGLLVFFLFIIASLYVGFAEISVSCARQNAGDLPTCHVHETRLWGLVQRKKALAEVSNAAYSTSNAASGARVVRATTIILLARDKSLAISSVALNVGDSWKAETLQGLLDFLGNPTISEYKTHISERNAFGYIGVLIVAFVAASYVLAAVTKVRARRR